jgi:hypothetical protein
MYTNLNDLQEHFLKGNVNFSKPFLLNEKEYIFNENKTPIQFVDTLIKTKQKLLSVCSLKEDENDLLVFAWAVKNNLQIVPVGVKHIHVNITNEDEAPQPTLGGATKVEFTSLPHSKPVDARVDTGAEICSLHVDTLKIIPNTNTVQFTASELSDRLITMHARATENVKSANGESQRIVVMMDIRIDGKNLSGVLFNLADRSNMEFPVLIGRNALEKGKFLIDPAKENVKFDMSQQLQELFESVSVPDVDFAVLEAVYTQMYNSNITLADLMKYMKTQAVSAIKDTEY